MPRRPELHQPAEWSHAFDDPIPFPSGRALTILRDADEYIAALSPKDQRQEHWQTAAEILLRAAQGRDLIMRALGCRARSTAPRRPARAAPQACKRLQDRSLTRRRKDSMVR